MLLCRNLGQKVFSKPLTAEADSWRESLYRVYRSGQQSMRVAVYGCKHDAALFESLLQQFCEFKQLGLIGDAMIDTACLGGPKVRGEDALRRHGQSCLGTTHVSHMQRQPYKHNVVLSETLLQRFCESK